MPNFAKMDPVDIVAHLGPERGERLIDFAAGSADLVFDLIKRHSIACDALKTDGSSRRIRLPRSRRSNHEPGNGQAWMACPHSEPAGRQSLVARGYVGGWMNRSGGVLNPVGSRGRADAAERAGANIFEHTPVSSVDRSPTGWTLKTPMGSVRRQVLIATNAYGGTLNPTLRKPIFR